MILFKITLASRNTRRLSETVSSCSSAMSQTIAMGVVPEEKKCVRCPNIATLVCRNCNNANYCSKEHQKEDWKGHKDICRPFIVEKNQIFGRYLVASRDLKPGELILKEPPTIVGPQINAAPLCLNCYKPIDALKTQITCTKCNVATFCTQNCTGSGHKNEECDLFRENQRLNSQQLVENCQIITPLRCLLLKKHNSPLWDTMMKLESHLESRRNTPIWRSHKSHVEDILQSYQLLQEDDIKEETVQKICGILDVNTFELRAPGFGAVARNSECIRGLYLGAALMAHDCFGNTHLAVDDDYNLIVHASVPIEKGNAIYFNYTNALQGTNERREHLKEGKYFSCHCPRCSDPTEFNTHMSSLNCVKCNSGYILSTKPTEERFSSNWKCQKCSHEYNGSMINRTIEEAQNYAENIDRTDVRMLENGIRKLLITLTKEHSIIMDLKQSLIGLHSDIIRREPNPQRKLLNRKLELCKEILPVLKKIEPGISRMQGIALYEMHIPMVMLVNRSYDNGEISSEDLLKTLLEAEDYLKQALSILLYEPNQSPEGRLKTKAMQELKFLRNSIQSVKKIIENKKENINKKRNKKKNK